MRKLAKILVTGASGFVGMAVQRHLRRVHQPVVAYMRLGSDPLDSCQIGSRVARGDILDRPALERAFGFGADACIHLVGIIAERPESSFDEIHVGGTRVLVDAATHAKTKKLIFISALGAKPNATSRYLATKWQAEEIVRGSGLPFTIIRPSVIFGEGSEFLAAVRFAASFPYVTPLVGPIDARFQPIYVGDLARILEICLTDERTDGATYEIGGPEVRSMSDMARTIENLAGQKKVHWPVPNWLTSLYAWKISLPGVRQLVDFVNDKIRFIPCVTGEQLSMLGEPSVCDMGPTKEIFQFEFTRFGQWVASPEFRITWPTWKSRWVGSPDASLPFPK